MSDIHDMAAFYAIGALEVDELASFEAHLEQCEACRLEVSASSAAVEALALAVAEEAPSELRDRVAATIDRQDAGVVVAMRGRGWRLAAIAATVAAAALAVAYVGSLDDARFGDDVGAVLAAADAAVVTVDDSAVGDVRLVYSAELERAVFSAASVPSPGADRTYQLWLIDDDGPSSLGLFTPGDEGTTVLILDAALRDGTVLGITAEPAGGSPQPTGEVLVATDL